MFGILARFPASTSAGDHDHRGHVGLAASRDAPVPFRDDPLERQRADRRDQADGRRERPECERPPREDETADRRPDRSGEPPRQRVHREVAAAQVIGRDLGDERLVSRAVEALADPEDRQSDSITTNAAVASNQYAPASSMSQATIQSAGIRASARMRRRPSMRPRDRQLHDHDHGPC